MGRVCKCLRVGRCLACRRTGKEADLARESEQWGLSRGKFLLTFSEQDSWKGCQQRI